MKLSTLWFYLGEWLLRGSGCSMPCCQMRRCWRWPTPAARCQTARWPTASCGRAVCFHPVPLTAHSLRLKCYLGHYCLFSHMGVHKHISSIQSISQNPLTWTLPSNVDVLIKLFSPRSWATFFPSSLFHRHGLLPGSSASITCRTSRAVNQTHNTSSAAIWSNNNVSEVRFHIGSPPLGGGVGLNSPFDTRSW